MKIEIKGRTKDGKGDNICVVLALVGFMLALILSIWY